MEEVGEFGLGYLPAELIEGILQRVGDATKRQAEHVDRGFAALCRRGAWRHCHSLVVRHADRLCIDAPLDVGSFQVESAPVAAAATRFVVARSRIKRVHMVDKLWATFDKQAAGRAVLAALMSERVSLESLVVAPTATRLFGGADQLAALVRRHSATLRQAVLHVSDDEREAAVHTALLGCPQLHELTAVQMASNNWADSLGRLVRGLPLRSLTLRGADHGLVATLLTPPTLHELYLHGVDVSLADEHKDWSGLQNVRVLDVEQLSVPVHDWRALARVLADVLPSLQTLIVRTYRPIANPPLREYVKAVTRAFFEVPGRGPSSTWRLLRGCSLAVQLRGGSIGYRHQLVVWQQTFPQLHVEQFDAAAAADAREHDKAASARPSLPKQFKRSHANFDMLMRRGTGSLLLSISPHI